MGNSELLEAVRHYQQCLDKYTRRNNEPRMLYCISKLYKMPVTVEHLEVTGVGRTVNALRKVNGEIGDAAKSLVAKWKEMVVGEDELKESSLKSENGSSHKYESKDKYKNDSSSSSHKESDTKSKYENKEKSSTSFYSEKESQSHQKREKEESKHKKHERSDKRDKESKSHKHKSSKRKTESENSDIEESDYEEERVSNHRQKSSKYKSEEDVSDDENYHKVKKDKRSSHKERSSKRKYDDSSSENDDEEINVKRKKCSESEESEDEETEEVETKKHFSKHHSKNKEKQSSELQEKSRHESKHKEKREKKEHIEDKVKKETDNKSKDKHSSKDRSKNSSDKKSKEDRGSDKKSKHESSKSHHGSEHKSKKSSSSHSGGGKVKLSANGIDSGSGASFAEALGMLVPSSSKANKKKVAVVHPFPVEKPKTSSSSSDTARPEPPNLPLESKLEPIDLNLANLLPEITPNYRPLCNLPSDSSPPKSKMVTEDEMLSTILYSKISRTKVYSGNKVFWGKVPSLFDLCTHVLQDNIDALEYTGGVPYIILKPVIERANPDQLFMLEHHNPYLIEDTDELWQLHCQKEFRNKKREEMETWRDMYMRCLDEREAKLKILTANIKQAQDKSLPVRQTKLAYVDSVVKPPRGIARKQAKHGTGAGSDKKPLVTPSSRLSALATAGAAGQIAVPNPGARATSSSSNSNAVAKMKKAPLMQKTLAFMKNRCFRR